MSIGSVVKKVVDYPLEKVASPESSYRKKAFYGAVIFGLSLASFLVYAGYACYYFANRKVTIEDPQKHIKTTGIVGKIFRPKAFHKKVASLFQPELTNRIKKEQTITENLLKDLIKEGSLTYDLNRLKRGSNEELKFIYDALLSFHELMEEIVVDNEKKDSYENTFFKARYLNRPYMLTFELREPGISLDSLHLWRNIMREYAPKGHENILAFTESRADRTRKFHIYLNCIEDCMNKETEKEVFKYTCGPLYSKDGCIWLKKGSFKKESK